MYVVNKIYLFVGDDSNSFYNRRSTHSHLKRSNYLFVFNPVFKQVFPLFCFQKSVPCDLCKEVLIVVEQELKDNATEVRLTKISTSLYFKKHLK